MDGRSQRRNSRFSIQCVGDGTRPNSKIASTPSRKDSGRGGRADRKDDDSSTTRTSASTRREERRKRTTDRLDRLQRSCRKRPTRAERDLGYEGSNSDQEDSTQQGANRKRKIVREASSNLPRCGDVSPRPLLRVRSRISAQRPNLRRERLSVGLRTELPLSLLPSQRSSVPKQVRFSEEDNRFYSPMRLSRSSSHGSQSHVNASPLRFGICPYCKLYDGLNCQCGSGKERFQKKQKIQTQNQLEDSKASKESKESTVHTDPFGPNEALIQIELPELPPDSQPFYEENDFSTRVDALLPSKKEKESKINVSDKECKVCEEKKFVCCSWLDPCCCVRPKFEERSNPSPFDLVDSHGKSSHVKAAWEKLMDSKWSPMGVSDDSVFDSVL